MHFEQVRDKYEYLGFSRHSINIIYTHGSSFIMQLATAACTEGDRLHRPEFSHFINDGKNGGMTEKIPICPVTSHLTVKTRWRIQ